MDEHLLKDLINSRNILKKKFQSIKLGENEITSHLENTFKPITTPLKNIVKLTHEKILPKYENITLKKEVKKENDFESERKKYKLELDRGDQNETNDEKFYSQSEEEDDENDTEVFTNLNSLYENKKLDRIYGPHKDENGVWKFGNSELNMNEDKIKIGNQTWALTPGLYELLFYKNPKNYDSYELDIYKKILISTSAHRRNHNPNEQINGNKGFKYTKIIKDLFRSTYTGEGLMNINLQKPNYIYWDDPNELVERLKLLMASKNAGHSNQNNEIISIIEELREANIIY